MKKDRQMVGTDAKDNDVMGGDWDDSNAESPGGTGEQRELSGVCVGCAIS
jgi:hypothetical protein